MSPLEIQSHISNLYTSQLGVGLKSVHKGIGILVLSFLNQFFGQNGFNFQNINEEIWLLI